MRSTIPPVTSRCHSEAAPRTGRARGGTNRRAAEAVELADIRGASTRTLTGRGRQKQLEQMVARQSSVVTTTTRSPPLALSPGGKTRCAARGDRCAARAVPEAASPAGVEANIRTNGEVDVSEEELARLDWVVASVHNAPRRTDRPTESSRRWTTRTSTASATSPDGRIRTRGPRT